MRQVERRPAREIAVEEAGGGRKLTDRRSWPRTSNRLANAFVGLGLAPGDRVAYVAQNHLEYVVLEFALLKAGLVKVPLNPRFTPHELRRCIELADVRLVVADRPRRAALDEVFDDDGPCCKVVIGARDGWLSFADLVAGWRAVAGAGARRARRPLPHPVQLRLDRKAQGHRDLPPRGTRGDPRQHLGDEHQRPDAAPAHPAGGASRLRRRVERPADAAVRRDQRRHGALRRRRDAATSSRTSGITWMFAVPTMLRRMSTSAGAATTARRRRSPA